MLAKPIARGSATRAANKLKRRDHILSCAGKLIAEGGIDAFTLSQLAKKAEVTVPTIHNLLGRKSQIFEKLVEEMVSGVGQVLAASEVDDPILAVEAFTDKLMDLYAQNEELYRAAFVAGEKSKLFDQGQPNGIFANSLEIAVQVCEAGKEHGYLQGDIDSRLLAKQLFASQRLTRHDWMHGYLDLAAYRSQVLIGMFVTLTADASPDYKKRLIKCISELERIG